MNGENEVHSTVLAAGPSSEIVSDGSKDIGLMPDSKPSDISREFQEIGYCLTDLEGWISKVSKKLEPITVKTIQGDEIAKMGEPLPPRPMPKTLLGKGLRGHAERINNAVANLRRIYYQVEL